MPKPKKAKITLSSVRSAVSRGTNLLAGAVDRRFKLPARFCDLVETYTASLGGEHVVSPGQAAIVRRCATLQLFLELQEQKWLANGGDASPRDLDNYQRLTGALRRCVESLELNHGPKTPPTITLKGRDLDRYLDLEAAE